MVQLGEWKEDPTRRADWRWWDGTRWGDHISRGGEVAEDRFPHIVCGRDQLDVVGEAHRQDALWAAVGHHTTERVRLPVLAYLQPQPDNPHDRNAVAVTVAGHHVGYVPRQVAAVMQPAVQALGSAVGAPIAVEGTIVGGGLDAVGHPRYLGVVLHHDATVFGLTRPRPLVSGPPDTGLGTAMKPEGSPGSRRSRTATPRPSATFVVSSRAPTPPLTRDSQTTPTNLQGSLGTMAARRAKGCQ